MATPKKPPRDPVRIYCNQCHNETLHKLLKEVCDKGTEQVDDYLDISWNIRHQMFECCGCKDVVLRRIHARSEWGEEPDVQYFPPLTSRIKPAWLYNLPSDIRRMLEEIYNSLNANNRALPLMGARAVLDMVMVEKIGDQGTFAQKLNSLESKGFISSKNKEILAIVLDAGSAATHRGFAPKLEQVSVVLDIVENLLQAVYLFQKDVEAIKKAIPPRQQRAKNSTDSSQ